MIKAAGAALLTEALFIAQADIGQSNFVIVFGGAVVSSLTGAVVYLFRDMSRTRDSLDSRLKECEADRRRLWERIAEIEAGGHE